MMSPINYVCTYVVDLELLEAWPLKCAYAVQEIFKTEVDYIDSLNDLIQVSADIEQSSSQINYLVRQIS